MFLISLIYALALLWDLSTGKIPNRLFFAGLAASQLWCLYVCTLKAAIIALLAGLLIALILFPLFMIGCLGAGDIKLLMILPAFWDFKETLIVIGAAFVLGAILGAFKLIFSKILIKRIYYFFSYLMEVRRTGRMLIYEYPVSNGDGRICAHQIHFSLPIFISVLMAVGGII